MNGEIWTKIQLDCLRVCYKDTTHQEIGRLLGKTRNAVRGKAWELKLRKKALPYSEEEMQIIRTLYGKNIPLTQIANKLNRPRTCVCHMAGVMGLTDMNRQRQLSDEQRQEMSNRTREWLRKHGHPRGYREIRTCPMCSRFFEVKHSLKQECCSCSCATRKRMKGMNMFSRSKIGKRKDLNGQFFRSNYEANYARLLNFFIENGSDITRWEYEPDTFEFKNIKRGTRFYTPDFKVFFNDGHIEYHEVKGWDYPKGITARKRFARNFPHLKLMLIDGDYFKAIKRQGVDRLINNWE